MSDSVFTDQFISPFYELVCYEYLWSKKNSSLKKLAEILSKKDILPSKVVESEGLFLDEQFYDVEKFIKNKIGNFSVLFKEDAQFPKQLLETEYPVDMIYYRGDISIANQKTIAIVGSRQASPDGLRRAEKLAKLLVQNKFAVVSGLAKGIDTAALESAIKSNGNVIGVIGTPIDEYYPYQNKDLQNYIAEKHLLISQVPMYKYSKQPFQTKRFYFPERNITMAAISDATVIVEASATSGTHTQAAACIKMKKKLFILDSCFHNPNSYKWAQNYLSSGAIRVRVIEDIIKEMKS